MTTVYMLMHSEEQANSSGTRSYNLLLPPAYKPDGYVTDHVGDTLIHPVSGATAWALHTEVFSIHPEADTHEFDDLMDACIAGGHATEQDKLDTQARILAARGATTSIYDVLPTCLTVMALDYDTMVADGWFDSAPE